MRILAVFLAFALSQSFAEAAGTVARRPLPFHLTPQGGVVVPVIVDGRGPVFFLVDTGSNGSAISEELASLLGARPVAKTTVTSAIGQKERIVVRIEHLSLGNVVADGILATVTPAYDFDVPDALPGGAKLQGVIGQDVLAGLRYTIDYRDRRIVWKDERAEIPRGSTVLALEPHDERFLVVLPQNGGTLKLVPDSGTDSLVLFRREGATSVPVTMLAGRSELSGMAGKGEARPARVDRLQVGGTTLTDYPAVVVERDRDAPPGDGLLPLHIFARATFNGPERQLILEPKR
jgi:predicted aspartyl protease